MNILKNIAWGLLQIFVWVTFLAIIAWSCYLIMSGKHPTCGIVILGVLGLLFAYQLGTEIADKY